MLDFVEHWNHPHLQCKSFLQVTFSRGYLFKFNLVTLLFKKGIYLAL